jgi:predicted RNase H-like nuclease (RuvC/YqgF family)
MKIEETKIPDVIKETVDKSKLVLANNIISNVYPLFDEVYNSRLTEIEKLKNKLKEKKKEVVSQKNELQQLMENYKKEKKVSKLLDRLEKMISSGLVYDGTIKHETTILLKIIDRLPDDKLDYHLSSTLQTLSKRFSR